MAPTANAGRTKPDDLLSLMSLSPGRNEVGTCLLGRLEVDANLCVGCSNESAAGPLSYRDSFACNHVCLCGEYRGLCCFTCFFGFGLFAGRRRKVCQTIFAAVKIVHVASKPIAMYG